MFTDCRHYNAVYCSHGKNTADMSTEVPCMCIDHDVMDIFYETPPEESCIDNAKQNTSD